MNVARPVNKIAMLSERILLFLSKGISNIGSDTRCSYKIKDINSTMEAINSGNTVISVNSKV